MINRLEAPLTYEAFAAYALDLQTFGVLNVLGKTQHFHVLEHATPMEIAEVQKQFSRTGHPPSCPGPSHCFPDTGQIPENVDPARRTSLFIRF